MNINLQVPLWTIEHVAAALNVSVDTAREYTYRADFPAPKALFARNLWTREEVLTWFERLPTRDRRSTKATTSTTKATHLKTGKTPAVRQPDGVTPAAAPKTIKSYKPRNAR